MAEGCWLIFPGKGFPRQGWGVGGRVLADIGASGTTKAILELGDHSCFRLWKRGLDSQNATPGDEVAGCLTCGGSSGGKISSPSWGLSLVLVFRRGAYKMNETKPQLLVFKGRPVSPEPGWIC